MSTLMSRDLNLTRPSTLVHAPPGGRSSICFGSEPAAPVNRAPQQQSIPKENNFGNANYDYKSRNNNSSAMKDTITQDFQAQPARRVRQAPGGNSTFSLA